MRPEFSVMRGDNVAIFETFVKTNGKASSCLLWLRPRTWWALLSHAFTCKLPSAEQRTLSLLVLLRSRLRLLR